MLRMIQRWFGLQGPQPLRTPAPETTVLWVRVPAEPAPAPAPAAVKPPATPAAAAPPSGVSPGAGSPAAGAARSTAAVPLGQLGLFPLSVLRRLRRVGIRTADDLLAATPQRLAAQLGAPACWAAKFRRYQRAIRFAQRFTAMTPLEALLLVAIHRRSRAALAAESPGVLRRDLQRLLLSSRGQKLAADRPAPAIQRVRRWIDEAKAHRQASTAAATSATTSTTSTPATFPVRRAA